MAQADRVLSTPRTNTPTSHDRLESAPGAVQLSPRALIRTSPPAACVRPSLWIQKLFQVRGFNRTGLQ
jgi:hypothetical protein